MRTTSAVSMVCSQRFGLGNATGYILSTSKYEKGKLTDWQGFHRWGGRSLRNCETVPWSCPGLCRRAWWPEWGNARPVSPPIRRGCSAASAQARFAWGEVRQPHAVRQRAARGTSRLLALPELVQCHSQHDNDANDDLLHVSRPAHLIRAVTQYRHNHGANH